MRLDMIHS